MSLKNIVDAILKENSRPLSWLADSMGKTFDGFKLSLIKESIKYKDIVSMAKILEVNASIFFETETSLSIKDHLKADKSASDDSDLKVSLRTYRELVATLKDQVKDKEKIISMLQKGK